MKKIAGIFLPDYQFGAAIKSNARKAPPIVRVHVPANLNPVIRQFLADFCN